MILLPLILFLFVGFVIGLYLFDEISWRKIIGYGYGLGVGAIGFEMFIFSLLHVSWNIVLILLPWIILFVFQMPRLIKIKKMGGLNKIAFDKLSIFFLICIGALIFFVIFEALLRPLSAWDGWSHWLLGSNAFFYEGRINPEFFKYANISYPPLINLMGTFAYILYGKVQDTWVLLLFTFFYVALLSLFYEYLKKYVSPFLALIFTFLLASTQNFIRQAGRYEAGNGDIILGYIFFASTMILLDVIKKPSYRSYLALQIMIGLATLIKSEAIPFFLIVETVFIGFMVFKKRYNSILITLVGVCIFLSWELFSFYYKLPQNPFVTGNIHITRLPAVLVNMSLIMFTIEHWNLTWVVILLSIVFIKKKIEILLASIVGIQLIVYLLIFLMTPRDPIAHLYNSFDRLLMHVTPIALFACALIISRVLKKYRWFGYFAGLKKRNYLGKIIHESLK